MFMNAHDGKVAKTCEKFLWCILCEIWYTDWAKLLQEHEICALVIKGTVDIQGLIALSQNKDFQAVYIAWMCAAPQNNKLLCDNPKYSGVGGHLFAIAADKSVEYGFGGTVVGYAANMDLVNHYCSVFKAEHIAMLHPFQIAIYEEEAELREVYDYAYTGKFGNAFWQNRETR